MHGGAREKRALTKRRMDENDAGADEVMKRDPGRAEPKSRRPSPESSRRPFVPSHTIQTPLFFSGWVIHDLKAGTAGGRTKFRPIWSVFRTSHRRSSCSPSCTYVVHGGSVPSKVGQNHCMLLAYPRACWRYAAGGFSPPICSDAEASAK